ncbi:AraC family transcriptional regulator [Flavobacterium sp.]|jgi:AraC-like DNA-binding protein|uniref:AraC family transcriptional regulator n=1 Tax=Flavobacterium sp. TaxID=239 RepID=UPI0037BFC22A
MKAVLEDIKSNKGTSSFYAYRFQVPFFEFKWHYHPEYELTYIIKGGGYRLVGNSYENYTDGDLVLLGSNLPHTWSGKSTDSEQSEAIVIQFSKEFIAPFLGFKESHFIKKMLEKSDRGIRFQAAQDIVPKLMALVETNGMERILKLLTLLEELSIHSYELITENSVHMIISEKSELRINKVCSYIQNNYANKITLKEMADLIYVTESNFCKFFKKATGKTYSDYLNEMRIDEASRLLLHSEKTINQIAFECGFETLSYFNKVFLNKKKMTPSNYRKGKL